MLDFRAIIGGFVGVILEGFVYGFF